MKGPEVSCPECGHIRGTVTQADSLADHRVVRRRRCPVCRHRWHTIQDPESPIDRVRLRYEGGRVVDVL